MKPGREMDALIAEKVMGEPRPTSNLAWNQHFTGSSSEGGNWCADVSGYDSGDEPTWTPKSYSTDIAAAWEVVEKLLKLGYTLELYSPGALINDEFGSHSVGWGAEFCTWEKPYLHGGRVGEIVCHTMDEKSGGTAIETTPEVICLAALKAVQS